MLRQLYLLLTVLGASLPLGFFLGFLTQEGLNLPLMGQLLFANPISSFAGENLLLTALVLLLYIWVEAGIGRAQRVVASLACLLVGPSFALPLVLFWKTGCSLPAR